MNLILLSNSKSGNGRAAETSANFERILRDAGHTTSIVQTRNGSTTDALAGPLANADALIVLGGDGTLHSAIDAAIHAAKPVYQVPLGTENLFAREFGMDERPETLLRALEARTIVEVDAATCNGRSFVLMLSVGPDASVIHRLERSRVGSISHLSYVRPVIAEAVDPTLAHLTVEVDGREVVKHQRGLLVVANSRQYALRIDPARRAEMDDGQLDVVFFPGDSRIDLIGWALTARLGTHLRSENLVYERGSRVRITSPTEAPVQLDGEAAGTAGQNGHGLNLAIAERKLRVLVPA